jgi:hypothetical protein
MATKTKRYDALDDGQRLTVVLEAEQLAALRLRAQAKGYSIGRVVRDLIARGLREKAGRS